jgi:hypothetical protein
MAAGCSLTHPFSPDHITDIHFVAQADHVPINLDEPTESCLLLPLQSFAFFRDWFLLSNPFVMFVSPAQVERRDDDTDILHARYQQQTGRCIAVVLCCAKEELQLGQAGPQEGVGGSVIHSLVRIFAVVFFRFYFVEGGRRKAAVAVYITKMQRSSRARLLLDSDWASWHIGKWASVFQSCIPC